MLHGPLAHHGYDWWWHSFTTQDAETGEDKPFFIEFFTCNPALGEDVIRTAVSLGGDCDTLTCIAGSMAEAFYGIRSEIVLHLFLSKG